MVLILEAGTADFAASQDSIFIPQSDLTAYGLDNAADCTNDASGHAKCLWAISKAIWDNFADLAGILGVSLNTPSSTNAQQQANGDVYVTHQYSGSYQVLADLKADTLGLIPVPSSGANSGVGDFALSDLLPNIAKVANAGQTGAAGLAIGFSSLSDMVSGLTFAGLNLANGNDNRRYFMAMVKSLANGLSIRTTGTASAFTAKSVGNLSSSSIPANYYSQTDPLSNISATKVSEGSVILLNQTFSYSLQSMTDIDNVTTVRVA